MSVDPPIDPTAPVLECTVDDVAAIIRTRTKDSNGNEIGTFNADTRPTADQVTYTIGQQVVLIHQRVGYVGDGCADLARQCVALGAAAEIELSYFPEQSRSDRSIYQFLIQRYEAAMDGLVACVSGDLPNSGGGDVEFAYRYGSLDTASSVVARYYNGENWPPVFDPAPPLPQPVDIDDADRG
jgi:hypothetical protein